MPVMTQPFAPNVLVRSFTPGDANTYHLVVDSNNYQIPEDTLQLPGARPIYVSFRSVGSDGKSDGSPFQILFNQTSTPAANTQGSLVSGSGQKEFLPGGFKNCYVMASVATDLAVFEIGY